MKRSRRYQELSKLTEAGVEYSLEDAVALLKKTAKAKFDESVEVAVRLGVDPRHADQVVRGTVSLPHGTGKKITEGWFEFDVVIATPDVMSEVGKLGRILGPRGLMPNPKSGTVTMDVSQAVKEVKAGKIDFRVDKTGNLHVSAGKASFSEQQLSENIRSFLETVIRLRPAAAKGQYLRSVTLSTTMGPGIPVDRNALLADLKS